MKKLIILFVLFGTLTAVAQTKGKVTGSLFFNYHKDMTDGAVQKSAYELDRAYLGYDYSFSDKFSAKVTLDVGKGTVTDYSYYLKAAQLDYKAASWAKLSAGMIGLNQFSDQEKFWGYRYLYKSFQDQHSFGTSADLGFNAELSLHKTLKMNLFSLNGEGYKKVQDLYGKYKVGGNLVYTPTDKITLKAYYAKQDSKKLVGTVVVENPTVSNLAFFAGYDMKSFRIGGEYNIMNNGKKFTDAFEDHDLTGFSIYSTYVINKKVELFARYDKLESNKVGTATANWNASKDGNALLAGLQFAPIKGVKSSLNYRTWNYDDATKSDNSAIYLNLEYKF
ncbi:hypothetical protein [Lutibacter sp.]|uniref:hypothetical protein n=1 Tax=Lutibacter sp. TaxID=1925666 RepID=UPI002732A9A7|nr:hypothetical protein [Lutibacter sp.]MDP3314006.1 hypothetical protein [Lutibacter sp.]